MDNELLNELTNRIDELERFIDKNLDNESPIWNASHIGDVPIDTKFVKEGWGFLYNKGKFELYPLGESKFYEHDKLTGYKKEQHLPADDTKTSKENLWTSKKVSGEIETVKKEIKSSRTQGNITINKTIKKARQELLKLIENSDTRNKSDILGTIKRLEKVQSDINVILSPSGLQGALQRDKKAIVKISDDLTKIKKEIEKKLSTEVKKTKKEVINSINEDLNSIEKQAVEFVNLKIEKLRSILYTKGEINKKFKSLSDRIGKIKPTTTIVNDPERELTDKEIKDLLDNRTPYGHKHRSKEVVHDSSTVYEELENRVKKTGDTMTGDLSFVGADIINPDRIQLNTSYVPNGETVGSFFWNDQEGTAELKLKGGNVTLDLGQEQVKRVVNKTGENLLESEFRVVRVRKVSEGGAQGQRLAVVLAQANNENNSTDILGLVTENIIVNEEGFITTYGEIKGINTTGSVYGETWVDGDLLFLSSTNPGGLTNVKPIAPNHLVIVGYVEYAHKINGKIFVNPDVGYELDELHNVKIENVKDKDTLTYNGNTALWENKPFTVPTFNSAPSSPASGQMYINSTDGNIYIYYGTSWVLLHNLGGGVTESYFLLENGNYLLLENGDKLILG